MHLNSSPLYYCTYIHTEGTRHQSCSSFSAQNHDFSRICKIPCGTHYSENPIFVQKLFLLFGNFWKSLYLTWKITKKILLGWLIFCCLGCVQFSKKSEQVFLSSIFGKKIDIFGSFFSQNGQNLDFFSLENFFGWLTFFYRLGWVGFYRFQDLLFGQKLDFYSSVLGPPKWHPLSWCNW